MTGTVLEQAQVPAQGVADRLSLDRVSETLYTASFNVKLKVLDFVKSGGVCRACVRGTRVAALIGQSV